MELITKRLKIIELTAADLDNVHYLQSLPEIDQYNTLGIPESKQITENIINEWLNLQKKVPRISHILAIRKIETNQFIGIIALTFGKINFKIEEVWYKILPSFWGQGLATEALKEILKFGFSTLKLHRIEAGCAVENVASFNVLEKAGMIREGQKRRVLPLKGQWSNNYIYGILDTDFDSIHV